MNSRRNVTRIVVALTIATMYLGYRVAAQSPGSYTIAAIEYPSSSSTVASGINLAGNIVGHYSDGSGTHGFLLSDGKYTAVDYPGAAWTVALGINNAGLIVGAYGPDPERGRHGFILSGRNFSSMEFPESGDTLAHAINNYGQVAGDYLGADGLRHGFVLSGGNFTKVEPPGSAGSGAWGINDGGQVVGVSGDSANAMGFHYASSNYTKIQVPDSQYSAAYGLNNLGDVVGQGNGPQPPFQGFRRNAGQFLAIPLPGSPSSWDARAINDLGQVVGSFTNGDGNTRGYRANPPGLQEGPQAPEAPGRLTSNTSNNGVATSPETVAPPPTAASVTPGTSVTPVAPAAARGVNGARGARATVAANGANGRGGACYGPRFTPPPPLQVNGTLLGLRDALRQASETLATAVSVVAGFNQSELAVQQGGQMTQGTSVQKARSEIEIALLDVSAAIAYARTHPSDAAASSGVAAPNFTAPPRPEPCRNVNMEAALSALKVAYEDLEKAPGGDFNGLRGRIRSNIASSAAAIIVGINLANDDYNRGIRGGAPGQGARGQTRGN